MQYQIINNFATKINILYDPLIKILQKLTVSLNFSFKNTKLGQRPGLVLTPPGNPPGLPIQRTGRQLFKPKLPTVVDESPYKSITPITSCKPPPSISTEAPSTSGPAGEFTFDFETLTESEGSRSTEGGKVGNGSDEFMEDSGSNLDEKEVEIQLLRDDIEKLHHKFEKLNVEKNNRELLLLHI